MAVAVDIERVGPFDGGQVGRRVVDRDEPERPADRAVVPVQDRRVLAPGHEVVYDATVEIGGI